jgi:hypothetical protein
VLNQLLTWVQKVVFFFIGQLIMQCENYLALAALPIGKCIFKITTLVFLNGPTKKKHINEFEDFFFEKGADHSDHRSLA